MGPAIIALAYLFLAVVFGILFVILLATFGLLPALIIVGLVLALCGVMAEAA